MNDNAKKWVEALRSGKYKQGCGSLRQGVIEDDCFYCCLGVACKLYEDEHKDSYWDGGRFLGESDARLPLVVTNWLGLEDSYGKYEDYNSLMDDNDNQKLSFDEIADIIESEPEGLFVS